MSILVDYQCVECRDRSERWVQSPPPAVIPCLSCGQDTRRIWAAIGLGGQVTGTGPEDPGSPQSSPALCRQYPQIPGLCHMTESAQRRWVATYNRDGRTLDKELERQEKSAAAKTPVLADAISHQHHHDVSATSL